MPHNDTFDTLMYCYAAVVVTIALILSPIWLPMALVSYGITKARNIILGRWP